MVIWLYGYWILYSALGICCWLLQVAGHPGFRWDSYISFW